MVDQASEGLPYSFPKRQRIAVLRPFPKGHALDVGVAAFVAGEDFVSIDIDPASIVAARRNFTRLHSVMNRIHFAGARTARFRASGNEEPGDPLGRWRHAEEGQKAGLRTFAYCHFLLKSSPAAAYAHSPD